MNSKVKFRIYNTLLNTCFNVSRIDYVDEQIYYYDKNIDEEYTVSFSNSILLMPTGISDLSGREIFEGDIVSYQENSFTNQKFAEVIFENGCFFTKEILSEKLKTTAENEHLFPEDFKNLLYLATSATYKPIEIIDTIFSYLSPQSI